MSHQAEEWLADPNRRFGVGWGSPDFCVQYVDCPDCKVKAGELCQGAFGPKLGHHYMRGSAYIRARRAGTAGPLRVPSLEEQALIRAKPQGLFARLSALESRVAHLEAETKKEG